jgi:hypothetical protein
MRVVSTAVLIIVPATSPDRAPVPVKPANPSNQAQPQGQTGQPPQRLGARLPLVRREIRRLECNRTRKARRNRQLSRKNNYSDQTPRNADYPRGTRLSSLICQRGKRCAGGSPPPTSAESARARIGRRLDLLLCSRHCAPHPGFPALCESMWRRFAALIATVARVRLTSSASLNCDRASS